MTTKIACEARAVEVAEAAAQLPTPSFFSAGRALHCSARRAVSANPQRRGECESERSSCSLFGARASIRMRCVPPGPVAR
jgi:hypothetical protein